MKEIKRVYSVLLKGIRKFDQRYKRVTLSGEEIFIPARSGLVRALIYKPSQCSSTEASAGLISRDEHAGFPILFDFHGGGFVFGLPEMDDRFCRTVADRLGIIVISAEYRLAPEFPYPAALEDSYDVIAYVHRNPSAFGIDPTRMAIGGHSAGANISTVVCMMAKKSREFELRCQVLDYPALDLKTDAGIKETPPGSIPPPIMEMFEECYCEPEERADIYVSPLLASLEELKGLPPAIVISAGYDSLKDENEDYADKLAAAGVTVEHYHYEKESHGFTIAAFSPVKLAEPRLQPGTRDVPAMPEDAKDALVRIMDLLRRYL